jgi:hypothetical protein
MIRWIVGMAVVMAAAGLPASGSVEFNAAAGDGNYSGGVKAESDLDAQGLWNLSLEYTYAEVTQTAAASQTHTLALELSKGDGDAWLGKVGVDYSNDQVNQIAYAGPSFALTYTKRDDTEDESGSVAARDKEEDEDDEAWAATMESTIHGYAVSLGALSGSGRTKKGVGYTLVNEDADLDLTQFYPSITLEKRLFGGWLTPSASYGYDFYDKDPTLAASIINRRFAGGGGRVGTLDQGLYAQAWNVAVELKLFLGLSLSGSAGQSLMISPDEWVQSYMAALSGGLGQHCIVSGGWTRILQAGVPTDEGTASMGWEF